MRGIAAILILIVAGGAAAADDIPLPQPRPATLLERFEFPLESTAPVPDATALAPSPELHGLQLRSSIPAFSDCVNRLSEIAAFTPLARLTGPGACGAVDVVRLEAVHMPDESRVTLNPPAMLRCSMAEEVTNWIRQDVGPAVARLGAPLAAIQNYDSFDCRGRNRIRGARLSEHGKANALDIRSLRLADGRSVDPTSVAVVTEFRQGLRQSACMRFMTVLGPGSDGYHESHIHVDLAERRHGTHVCRWQIRETAAAAVAEVPRPLPRPAAAAELAKTPR